VNESQAIDPDGNITVPRLGKIRAAGSSPVELARQITQAVPNNDDKVQSELSWSVEKVPAGEGKQTFDQLQANVAPGNAPAPVAAEERAKKDQAKEADVAQLGQQVRQQAVQTAGVAATAPASPVAGGQVQDQTMHFEPATTVPTTLPLSDAAVADERVDVVIFVCRDDSPAMPSPTTAGVIDSPMTNQQATEILGRINAATTQPAANPATAPAMVAPTTAPTTSPHAPTGD
jgi:hypothetical protein